MPRKVIYRDERQLEQHARLVLSHYEQQAGWTPSLPIPIEQIIESVYDLTISWEPIEEQPGERILGMLVPATKTIIMNEGYAGGILGAIGPTNFTLAHELGHWLFDADDPDQGELFDVAGEPSEAPTSRIRTRCTTSATPTGSPLSSSCRPDSSTWLGPSTSLGRRSSQVWHTTGVCPRTTLEIRIQELSALPKQPALAGPGLLALLGASAGTYAPSRRCGEGGVRVPAPYR